MPLSSRRSKFRAHLPATQIPSNLYFHCMTEGAACSPETVTVITDAKTKSKVSPMVSAQTPECISPDQVRYYRNAVAMAERGNSLVFVLKEAGFT